MKELLNTLTTPSNLKSLIGKDLSYAFPLKYPKETDKRKAKLRKAVTLAEIIKSTPDCLFKSFDDRWDGKHLIIAAIEQLQYKGLTKATVHKIINNKSCVKKNAIVAVAKFQSGFITDVHRAEIVDKLKKLTVNKYNQIVPI